MIVGGLGFPVWLELRRGTRAGPGAGRLHTKLTLVTTGALLALERRRADRAGVGERRTPSAPSAPPAKLLGGFFAAVTARSAGFNAVDYADMGTDSLFVTDMLMFVGGGSASPAGGIKVTTLAILFLIVWAELRGEREVTAFEPGHPGARRCVRR